MLIRKIRIENPSGLHMRPAGLFVKAIEPFNSKVTIKVGGHEYNAKSMLKVISAGVKCGDEIEVIVNGEDEHNCLAALMAAIESGFGEL